jgi:hypothetical protein
VVPTRQEHLPALQVRPAPQSTPQPPQLVASVRVSTQRPPQRVRGEAQTHAPAAQYCESGHTFPQAPQLLRSLRRSRQPSVGPQAVWSGAQAQAPATQS